ncbi:MAG TPA: PQQ-binding-like beta-propeller repeat protein [Gemmatimonadaceae bacterium]|nr:PQQ-binding-like beta-propeller repeat protein [Gemmatimonadaceae bacterium]
MLRAIAGALTLLILAIASPIRAQQKVVWRYAADTDIAQFQQTPLGSLVVAAGTNLTSLDPATGAPTWSISDSISFAGRRLQMLPLTPYLWLTGSDGTGVIDLQHGIWKWRAASPTLGTSRGTLFVPEKLVVLEYVVEDEAHPVLQAIDVETGHMRWQLDTVLAHAPPSIEVRCCGDRKLETIEGNQPPYFDGDSTLVLWITQDGPIGVNVTTGAVLWKATWLRDKRPPATSDGYARMLDAAGVLYVPYENSLMAIKLRDGTVAWEKPREYRSHIAQMRLVRQGLLVRGASGPKDGGFLHRPVLEVLDAKTGAPLWKEAFTDLSKSTPFIVRGDTAYLSVEAHSLFSGTHQKLMAIALDSGRSREVVNFQFRGDEWPAAIQSRPSGIVLMSSQNVLMVDSVGLIRYQTYFRAPQASALKRFGLAALVIAADVAISYGSQGPNLMMIPGIDTRYRASVEMERYMFIRTPLPDSLGDEVQGFVRVDKDTGKDNGRAAIGVKTGYSIDEVDGRVYYLAKPRELVALRF